MPPRPDVGIRPYDHSEQNTVGADIIRPWDVEGAVPYNTTRKTP